MLIERNGQISLFLKIAITFLNMSLGTQDYQTSYASSSTCNIVLSLHLLLLLSHFSRVRLCATPWTAAHQAPPSMGFSRQEYWSGVPLPSPSLHLRWDQPHDLPWRQFSSVTQSCPTLCDPMDCSTPGLPVHHQLPEFTQTHVHWVGGHPTISSSVVPFSSHLQSFPASGSFQMSQLFASGGQSIRVSRRHQATYKIQIKTYFPNSLFCALLLSNSA